MYGVIIGGSFTYKGMSFNNVYAIPMLSLTGNQDTLAGSIYYYFSKAIAEANISNNLEIDHDPEGTTPTNFNFAYNRTTDGADLLKLALDNIKAQLIDKDYTQVVSELD